MSIAIVDFGMANLRSVQKGFAQAGFAAEIVSDPAAAPRFDRMVLPGVGAFKDAIATLKSTGWAEAVRQHVKQGRTLLGICLGLQLLFDTGYEDGEHQGLGIIAGDCVRFDVDSTLGLKVPHMGWNSLKVVRPCPLYRDLPEGAGVYFVHSYHVRPKDKGVVATYTDYGRDFVSSIWRQNVMATQFHPEKSQKVGLKILENFARL
jgi:glutamine amidotransferase